MKGTSGGFSTQTKSTCAFSKATNQRIFDKNKWEAGTIVLITFGFIVEV